MDNVEDARALLTLGDTVTTDHISPAGLFGEDLPAGQWLKERDVAPTSSTPTAHAGATTRS